jgi:hypothetical protein
MTTARERLLDRLTRWSGPGGEGCHTDIGSDVRILLAEVDTREDMTPEVEPNPADTIAAVRWAVTGRTDVEVPSWVERDPAGVLDAIRSFLTRHEVPRAPVKALLAALDDIDAYSPQTVDLDAVVAEVRRHLDESESDR